MDESLRDSVYEEVFDTAPLDSEEEFAELERRVIHEAKILEDFYSTDGPHVCTYTPACTDLPHKADLPSSQHQASLVDPANPADVQDQKDLELDHGVICEAEILEGCYSTNSPHVCTDIPICTYSHHALPSDAQEAESRVKLSLKEQPQELSAKHKKPKGQKKRKQKVKDEHVPRKRHCPDLQQFQEEPTILTDLLHKEGLPSPQHQGNLVDTASLADPVKLENLKHQANHTDPASLANIPIQANPASYTSSSISIPPTHRDIPANFIQYTRVVSLEQRERYLRDYRAAYYETDYLFRRIRWNRQHFAYCNEQPEFLVPGSKVFQTQPGFNPEMNRYFYLMSMMAHISQLIEEFDYFYNQSAV